MVAELPASDRAWLRALEERLWETHTTTHPCSHGRKYSTERTGSKITPEEWKIIRVLIERHELPTSLSSAAFCFGLALSIWNHATPPEHPEYLVGVSGMHLPDYGPDDCDGFDIGWKHFAPVATTRRNAELLVFYGMEPIKEKSHYDY